MEGSGECTCVRTENSEEEPEGLGERQGGERNDEQGDRENGLGKRNEDRETEQMRRRKWA